MLYSENEQGEKEDLCFRKWKSVIALLAAQAIFQTGVINIPKYILFIAYIF